MVRYRNLTIPSSYILRQNPMLFQKVELLCVAKQFFKFYQVRQQADYEDSVAVLYHCITGRYDQLFAAVYGGYKHAVRECEIFQRFLRKSHALVDIDLDDLRLSLYEAR